MWICIAVRICKARWLLICTYMLCDSGQSYCSLDLSNRLVSVKENAINGQRERNGHRPSPKPLLRRRRRPSPPSPRRWSEPGHVAAPIFAPPTLIPPQVAPIYNLRADFLSCFFFFVDLWILCHWSLLLLKFEWEIGFFSVV